MHTVFNALIVDINTKYTQNSQMQTFQTREPGLSVNAAKTLPRFPALYGILAKAKQNIKSIVYYI